MTDTQPVTHRQVELKNVENISIMGNYWLISYVISSLILLILLVNVLFSYLIISKNRK